MADKARIEEKFGNWRSSDFWRAITEVGPGRGIVNWFKGARQIKSRINLKKVFEGEFCNIRLQKVNLFGKNGYGRVWP
ncbi:MAG: hypothetical protein MPJ24_06540, partial [Pirellulaceae bacterium]|nr:hypothetical protein [Pirellulaceae bacterium]